MENNLKKIASIKRQENGNFLLTVYNEENPVFSAVFNTMSIAKAIQTKIIKKNNKRRTEK